MDGYLQDDHEQLGDEDEMQSDVKVIILGDSAVGKSKLVERYLEDDYSHHQV